MDDLPVPLRDAIAAEAQGHDLRKAVRDASDAYRSGLGTRVTTKSEALAYAVWRMPATYAATLAALRALALALPGWSPRSLLDLGAGPATAGWAATAVFPDIESATFVETAAPMRELGRRLTKSHPILVRAEWPTSLPEAPADLVVCSYAASEVGLQIIDRLWELTSGALVIVEPGTPRGFRAALEARDRLIELGAFVAAPCPAHIPCPMAAGPDWCHFSTRLRRDALHAKAKNASLPFEDEPYSYVAASRTEPSRASRLIGRPRFRRNVVRLPLCTAEGLEERIVTKRHAGYKSARKLHWGDAVDQLEN